MGRGVCKGRGRRAVGVVGRVRGEDGGYESGCDVFDAVGITPFTKCGQHGMTKGSNADL